MTAVAAPVAPAPPRQSTFASLSIPNYRRYLSGQLVSLIGTWMETLGQAVLVLQLSHNSGTTLGLVTAARFLPILFVAPYGGLLADRFDKRRLLTLTQVLLGTCSLCLGLLVVTGAVRLWQVVILSVLFGLANAVDNPTRQSFVGDMVDREHLRNAVTLNSTMVNVARAVGPAIAGVLVTTVGVGACFLVNAASFGAVVVALRTLDGSKLHPTEATVRAKGQLREGFHYVRSQPALLAPLLMMALVGTLTYEFQVSLPLVAHDTFHGGASAYSILTASNGVGAVCGGLYAARRARTGLAALTRSSVFFGLAVLAAALAPWFWLEAVLLAVVGAASVGFLTAGNSTVQLGSDPHFRGRVMALWSVAFLGSTPIGSPIVGSLADLASARWSLVVGALACGVAAVIGMAAARTAARLARSAPATP